MSPRTLFPFFSGGQAPPAAAATLPLYKDVLMDYEQGIPVFDGGEPVIVSGLEAVKSWAWRSIMTERYLWEPFSWDYGCELMALVGQPYNSDTRLSEARRYVEEALTVSPYITSASAAVEGLVGSALRLTVQVRTIYGETEVRAYL